ncbi:hypothetical protein F511_03237 [Dorcoceras hygrometricum]|uniref:Uncharacterized protein n=1 Tax=Dorcoceras hygrometricum TaxID=472368 RepID=A0A2Z7B9H6_9LAMI|nr:hypothetical protein F511_03237 [Dorcoceras hygrometricum]
MVVSWILNTIEPTLRSTITFMEISQRIFGMTSRNNPMWGMDHTSINSKHNWWSANNKGWP